MKIEVQQINIKQGGIIEIEVNVPKKVPGGTRFDGTKYESYTYHSLYRITINGRNKYIDAYCLKDGWNSYPDRHYEIIRGWWMRNKRNIIQEAITQLNKI